MFEFEIIVSASFVPLYQFSMFFLRFQIDLFRRHSVTIFECHSVASNLSFPNWKLTNCSCRRACADGNAS